MIRSGLYLRRLRLIGYNWIGRKTLRVYATGKTLIQRNVCVVCLEIDAIDKRLIHGVLPIRRGAELLCRMQNLLKLGGCDIDYLGVSQGKQQYLYIFGDSRLIKKQLGLIKTKKHNKVC